MKFKLRCDHCRGLKLQGHHCAGMITEREAKGLGGPVITRTAKPKDTRYSDEDPIPGTPVRHGADPWDPAGLWNPPGPADYWPRRKK